MKVRATLIEEMLGSASANKEIHEEFVAAKSADKEKIKEELAALPAEDLMEKSVTVFHRDENDNPIIWDYQIRGHIKSFFQVKTEFGDFKIKVGQKEFKFSKWTFKRLVDNFIFIKPRQIALQIPEGGQVGSCTRSLRADTMKGPRIALATSETVPAGTTFEFEILTIQPELSEFFAECLDYGALNGLGQWRGGGKGSFTWEEIE